MGSAKRKQEYLAYLGSEAWGEQRAAIMSLAENMCEFCARPAEHVHHIRYPKVIGEENPRYLAAVCKGCHETAHGGRTRLALNNVVSIRLEGVGGRPLHALDNEGVVWCSAESWAHAIAYPKDDLQRFKHLLVDACRVWMETNPTDPIGAEWKDTPVYRWPAVSRGLRMWWAMWKVGELANCHPDTRLLYERMAERIDAIEAWAARVVEGYFTRELKKRMGERTDPASEAEQLGLAIAKLIAPRLQEHDRKIEAHDLILSNVQGLAPFLRDPEEYITVKQACLELSYPPAEMPQFPQNRHNLCALAGVALTEKSATRGPQRNERLDGRDIVVPVNSYKRSDVYAVLRQLKGTPAS